MLKDNFYERQRETQFSKTSIKITFYSRVKNKKIVATNDITVITMKKTTQFLIVLIFFFFQFSPFIAYMAAKLEYYCC